MQATSPQNPPLQRHHGPLRQRQRRLKVLQQRAARLHFLHPACGGISILLVGGAPLPVVAVAKQRWLDLYQHRLVVRNGPAIKRPDMQTVPSLLTQPM